MMKRILTSAAIATAVATLSIAVGCGSSTSGNNNGNPDGGGNGSSSGTSSGTASGSSSGGASSGSSSGGANDGGTSNPALPDGSILPHGNQLVTGNPNISINGVTKDDFVIYTDVGTGTAYARSLAAGSQPISLGTVDANDHVFVLGNVVLLATSATSTKGAATTGAVSVWTSTATAPAALGTSVVLATYELGVSSDDTSIVYIDDASASAGTGNLYVAGADGSNKKLLVSNIDIAFDACTATVGFSGAYALASYCVVPDGGAVDAGEADGGTNLNVATVSSFTGASWTQATIATNVQSAFSAGGTSVVVLGAAGTAAYPIGGGAAVPIDAAGELGFETFSPGLVTADGAHVVYTTGGQALERAATTAPASPVQLAAAGTFADVYTFSPDGNWVVGSLNQSSQGLTDLFVSSSTTAGTPIALDSNTDSYPFIGDLFTADSSYAVYLSGLGENSGTLNARKLTAGSTATVLATNALTDYATTAAKIVFNANIIQNGTYGDLMGVDTAQTAAPALLVSAADATFVLNHEKNTIVYTWSYDNTSNAGLWTLATP